MTDTNASSDRDEPARLHRRVAVAGALMLLAGLATGAAYPLATPGLPDGILTPILAFEVARTPAEVELLMGPAGTTTRAELAAAMQLGHRIDFAFLLAYAAFGALVARAVGAPRWAALAFPIAAAADIVENLQLIEITGRLGADYGTALARLIPATWTKWLLVAVGAAAIAAKLRLRNPVVALISAALLPITLLSATLRGPWTEAMGGVTALAFLAWWSVSIRHVRAARKRANETRE